MKKVLMVVHDMKIGGVQKSLLSFLQCFSRSTYVNQYQIHLLIQEPIGELLPQIPACVQVVPPSKPLRWLGSPMSGNLIRQYFSWAGLLGEIHWIVRKKLGLLHRKNNAPQKLWDCWKRMIPQQAETYDVVVSYQDGCSNYYAIDKVNAAKKILWMHSEYQKQGYNPDFDRQFFEKADAIITISENCRECLLKEFQEMWVKLHVIENITMPELVLEKGEEEMDGGYEAGQRFRILSIGRLHELKGFDIAIYAAKNLKETGKKFQWIVVGEGPEHARLQEQIDALGVGDCFKLLGARENPYPYLKACDLLVQSSRVEGKSIVLDEAKVFCRPIVATNYTTVAASITHGEDGWVVDMTPEALSEGIVHMMDQPGLREQFKTRLAAQAKGNVRELERYMEIMLK